MDSENLFFCKFHCRKSFKHNGKWRTKHELECSFNPVIHTLSGQKLHTTSNLNVFMCSRCSKCYRGQKWLARHEDICKKVKSNVPKESVAEEQFHFEFTDDFFSEVNKPVD